MLPADSHPTHDEATSPQALPSAEGSDAVDVPALLTQILDEALMLPMESKPTLSLRLESAEGLIGGQQELRSAFTNLILNALKYCEKGDHVEIIWQRDEPGIRLDVRDTGPGIAPEYLPRLTERFYRVDASRGPGGTGLGLAIVKHVMARHGAEFTIISTVGKGSTFSCRFPTERIAKSL